MTQSKHAPKLLEALQDLVDALQKGMGKTALDLRIELALSAIAKAEGKL